MKVLLLIVAIAAVAYARPPPRPRGPPVGPPCRIEFTNGTVIDLASSCFSAGGIFACEAADLSRFDGAQRPPHLQDVASISFCGPKSCKTDADCPGSVCTSEPRRPDEETREEMETLLNSCLPDRPPMLPRPKRQQSSEEDDEDMPDRPKRCSVPPVAQVASMACRVTYDGKTTEKPCGLPEDNNKCRDAAACSVTINGKPASLSFCERPPQPPIGQHRPPKAPVALAHPPPRPRGPPIGPPCRIEFTNGTVIDLASSCFSAGGIFACEAADLSRFDGTQRPPHLQNVAKISFCGPKSCKSDADCSGMEGSVCTSEPRRPDEETREEMETLLNSCLPDRPPMLPRPERQHSSEEDDEDRPDGPKRCSVPPVAQVASMACRVTYDGKTTNRPCGLPEDNNKCSDALACSVTIDGKPAELSFCERPPRPPIGHHRPPHGHQGPPPSQG